MILIALLIAASIALLLRNAGDDERIADRAKEVEPIARNVPPPATPEPQPQEQLAFDPSETEAIGSPAAPSEVLEGPADRSADTAVGAAGDGDNAKTKPKTESADQIARTDTGEAKTRTKKSKAVPKLTDEDDLPQGDADELALNQPSTTVTVEQTPEQAALEAEEAKKRALAEIEAELGESISAESRVEIVYREDIDSLKTEEIALMIDGQPITTKGVAPSEKTVETGLTIFNGVLPAGTRNVQLRVKLRGDGDVFSYLKDYAFHLNHQGTLKVEENKATRLTISAAESKNVTREWTDKFALRVDVSTREAGSDIATR